ncbi:hypothetical protein D3C73_1502370 [compost metagenome]
MQLDAYLYVMLFSQLSDFLPIRDKLIFPLPFFYVAVHSWPWNDWPVRRLRLFTIPSGARKRIDYRDAQ